MYSRRGSQGLVSQLSDHEALQSRIEFQPGEILWRFGTSGGPSEPKY